jgi:hypothetical protein
VALAMGTVFPGHWAHGRGWAANNKRP